MNKSALAHWKAATYTDQDVLAVCQKINSTLMAMRIVFLGDGNCDITLTQKTYDTKEGHAPMVVNFFHSLAASPEGRSLKGSFLVWLEDGMGAPAEHLSLAAPMFAFGRRKADSHTFLMPDPAFIGALGYERDRSFIQEMNEHRPWKEREPKLFWRGAASGCSAGADSWFDAPRIRLARLSKELNTPAKLDARVTRFSHLSEEQQSKLVALGLTGKECDFREFLKYRYQLDIDGYSCSWISSYTKLSSHSLTFKVESDLTQWYFNSIKPWTHYIPVNKDLSDLVSLIDWARENDEKASQIAEHAASEMNGVTLAAASTETIKVLRELFSCERGAVENFKGSKVVLKA